MVRRHTMAEEQITIQKDAVVAETIRVPDPKPVSSSLQQEELGQKLISDIRKTYVIHGKSS
jgi:hypothetical protein